MQCYYEYPVPDVPRHTSWNKGKIIGPKPPLQPKHVWLIRARLQGAGHHRPGTNLVLHLTSYFPSVALGRTSSRLQPRAANSSPVLRSQLQLVWTA